MSDNNFDIESSIKQTISAYVDFIKKQTKHRNLQIFHANVQAPNHNFVLSELASSIGKVEENIVRKYLEVPVIFNSKLKEYIGDFCPVIDLYNKTLGQEGFANPDLYLDQVHLRPDILGNALEKH